MTPADFKTLRERLGLSGEAFGRLLERGVTDRTVRRWEAGKLPIPADAEATVRALDAMHENAVATALNTIQFAREKYGGEPETVDLVRYTTEDALARAHPELAIIGVAGHAAMIGRVREAIQRAGVPVRIVFSD